VESASEVSSSALTLLPDTVGRYILRAQLGKGAMGEVWRAEDPQIGREVAVKLLHVPDGLSDENRGEWEARFLREARAAGRLSHPGIVAIHDVGTSEDGQPFIVMELVEGRGLDAVMKEGPRQDPAAVLDWGAQLAEALDSAHRRGVVHRDIKPANILIDENGRARIADFGIARISESELTREGSFLGSPAYASPEQIRGQAVDGRADLFSLGATLYSLLAGERPFRGEDITSLAYAICHVTPAPPSRFAPSIPAGCDAVILKALAKDPADRYPSAHDFAADLEAIAAGRPPAAAALPAPIDRTLVGEGAASPGRPGSPAAAPASPPATDPHPDLERRASAAGSLLGLAVARTIVALSIATRSIARGIAAAARFAWPWIRRGAAATLRGLACVARAAGNAWSRGWGAGPRARIAMAAGLAVVLASLAAGGAWLMHRPARASFAASLPQPRNTQAGRPAGTQPEAAAAEPASLLSSILPAATAPVTVRVVHGLQSGTVTIWADGRRVLYEDLEADSKAVRAFGAKLLSYRKATQEFPIRLAGGAHSLKVRVSGTASESPLEETIAGAVDPEQRYALEIRVKGWPGPRMDLDWSRD